MSLETLFVLPVLAMLTLGLLGTVTILRDVLLLHEATRVGARVAATTVEDATVHAAVRTAAPELEDLSLQVSPSARGSGDVVTVSAAVSRSLGPTTFRLRARAHARVEPIVDAPGTDGHPWWSGAGPNAGPRPAPDLAPVAPPGEPP
ncbi:TadE family type IV pilus minor pilin [Egicoccus halophilus]|uniref:TadE-like protein n=1 Tax=Egicoccus halophilus TaxID=1670830 RepID=A0A8J3AFT3_9ACTN|nr:TadE family type IV pilus minor pilin [Egicoccus halophilus]GGI07704.1 hypothetical protein GCM10011354_25420 [Egicoccus halophilus]